MKIRLEGVNALLKAIGEIPLVSEADFSLSAEAVQAEEQILSTLDSVLSRGWKFNRFNAVLVPDLNGYISKPPSALVIEFTDESLTFNEGLLFSRTDFTTKFTSAVECIITYRENFDFTPNIIQEYVIAKASQMFQSNTVNDAEKNRELREEVREKQVYLNAYHIRQTKANGKDSRFGRNSNPVNT